jgi:hypothetical protein
MSTKVARCASAGTFALTLRPILDALLALHRKRPDVACASIGSGGGARLKGIVDVSNGPSFTLGVTIASLGSAGEFALGRNAVKAPECMVDVGS